jgi:hypothetical protein
MQKSDVTNELMAALSKAQGEIAGAPKDSINPHYKSRFSSLESVLDCIKAPFAKNGLCVVQGLLNHDGELGVETLLGHSSGQWMSSTVFCKPIKTDPQGLGATATYLRRFALSALCGVAQIDDDGETACGKGERAIDSPEQPKRTVANPIIKPAIEHLKDALKPSEGLKKTTMIAQLKSTIVANKIDLTDVYKLNLELNNKEMPTECSEDELSKLIAAVSKLVVVK